MPAKFDHEKPRAHQEALRFVAWSEPVLATFTGTSAARDPLDRASTRGLDIAAGDGKRSAPDRCRLLDLARGSGLRHAAGLEVTATKRKFGLDKATAGNGILIGELSMIAGLIARFSPETYEDRPANPMTPEHTNKND
jgi:hypothetical protein